MPVLVFNLRNLCFASRQRDALRRLRPDVVPVPDLAPSGLAPTNELFDDAWRQFACGRLGQSEYARHLRARYAPPGDDLALTDAVSSAIGGWRRGASSALEALRRNGWQLVAAGNVTPWEDEWVHGALLTPGLVDRLVTSLSAEAALPESRFFVAVRRAALALGDTHPVYVDDDPVTVGAAEREGCRGMVVASLWDLVPTPTPQLVTTQTGHV